MNCHGICALSVVASLCAACAAGPDFRRPAPPPTESYVRATPAPVEGRTSASEVPEQALVPGATVPAQWWKLFRCDALDGLVSAALEHSPTLQEARARLLQAQAELQAQTGATRYPAVDAQLGVTRQKVDPAAFGIPNVPSTGPFTLYNAQVSVSYTFDLFGGNRRALESVAQQVDYEAHELDAARVALAANVVTAAIRRAQLRAEISDTERMVDAQRQATAIAQERYRAGGISLTELQNERSRLAQASASLVPPTTQAEQIDHQLAVYIGEPPALAAIPTVALKDLSLPTELPLTLPSELVRRRPDVLAAEALWHQASANVGVATAHLWPQLTISGSAGAQRLQADDLVDGINVWSIGARLLQPIFHGGELVGRKHSAVAAYDAAAAAYTQVVLQSLQQVADSLGALDGDAQAVQARRDAARLADASLRIARERYALGGISHLELLDAQRQQLQGDIDQGRAEADRYTQTVALLQALGGGW